MRLWAEVNRSKITMQIQRLRLCALTCGTGIFNGDNVLVKKQPNADNGDIVVALVDDSATVKPFYKEDGYYRLQPENDTMDPIIVKECSILGKVFGVFRFL